MSVERRLLPASGYVATGAGPCLVSALLPGDELVLVRGDGSLGSEPIVTIDHMGSAPCAQLLSKAGQLVAPIESRITTSAGHRTAGELLLESRAGHRVRLEILSHSDLPPVSKKAATKQGAASAYALFDGQVLVPWPVASLPRHEQALADLQKALGEPVERIESEGWLVLSSGHRLADLAPGRSAQLAAEADPLTTLMAWEPIGEGWSIRSPLARIGWTQRALASLAAAGISASVTWQPGYLPVEARVALGAAPRGHYDVAAAQVCDAPCLAVGVEGRGSVVLCGAMVDART
jgi:hypothetical protein